MSGPVKTVCFIASLVIAWNLFEVGEAIVAWFDYKISGTEIPWNLKINPNRANHIISILVHGFFLLGISKKTTKFMIPWALFFAIFIVAGLIPTGIFGFRLMINLCFLPNHYEIDSYQYQWICMYLTIFIYGKWVEEILKPIIEKEEAKKNEEFAKYWAKIEDDMETKKREKNTISEKEPYMVSTMVVENEK